MSGIFFDQQYSQLIKQLTDGEVKMFRFNKDLALFAAMVGYDSGQDWQLGRLEPSRRGAEAPGRVFENHHDSGLAYLTSIAVEKNTDALRDSSATHVWEVFESYVNLGMEIIEKWVTDSPGQDLHQVLLSKIATKASEQVEQDEDPDSPETIF